MAPDTSKINTIIQFSLLVAGQEDEFLDRGLGAIHLIKYVYLADLIFAERKGHSYTGVNWQFYKFGPWSQCVNSQIDSAVAAIHAEKFTRESDYGDDEWIRWNKTDQRLLDTLENKIPIGIRSSLRKHVHRFTNNTSALLDFVYQSKPMLSAAPLEYLDFSLAQKTQPEKPEAHTGWLEKQSKNKQTKFKERIKALREKRRGQQKQERSRKLVKPKVEPIYDDVYEKGVQWLDSLAGQELPTGQLTAEFSDDIWKYAGRSEQNVS